MPIGIYKRTLKIKKALSKARIGIKFSKKHKNNLSKARRAKIKSIRCRAGYQIIKIKQPNTWILYHRFRIEKYIGYKLKKGWIVHHIDGNGLNNKLKNLYIFIKNGLHRNFGSLVNYNIIDRFILKSNLNIFKK